MNNYTTLEEFRKRLVRDIALAEKLQVEYKCVIVESIDLAKSAAAARKLSDIYMYLYGMNDCLILLDATIGEFDDA